eukprot:TRINITY_DN25468_c0_g1_i2.p1 TRINITY_DN25468_c0_g1~~TRINITY_DN25468_c0_g1_i2.p1  ORF type:complete len:211 (+),score=30.05 TRINITY_DN25468_c0_g1_i2:168-800(+)
MNGLKLKAVPHVHLVPLQQNDLLISQLHQSTIAESKPKSPRHIPNPGCELNQLRIKRTDTPTDLLNVIRSNNKPRAVPKPVALLSSRRASTPDEIDIWVCERRETKSNTIGQIVGPKNMTLQDLRKQVLFEFLECPKHFRFIHENGEKVNKSLERSLKVSGFLPRVSIVARKKTSPSAVTQLQPIGFRKSSIPIGNEYSVVGKSKVANSI